MHGALQEHEPFTGNATGPAPVALLGRCLHVCNSVILAVASVAMVVAAGVLSYSVLVRAIFNSPTYWQDEAAVFLLVGVTFMTSAFVQSQRGHIGIEAFVGLLSPGVNRIRLLLIDIASFLFCAFFAWKSWTLTHEAWVNGEVTDSIWAPPLAIPYGLMALGMTLLCIQIFLQILTALTRRSHS